MKKNYLIYLSLLLLASSFVVLLVTLAKYSKPASLPIINLSPTSVPVIMKTYVNQEHNLTLNYPSDWEINETNNSQVVSLSNSNQDGSIVIDFANQGKITSPIKKWIEQENKNKLSNPNRHHMDSLITIVENDNLLNFSPEELVTTDNEFFGHDGKKYIFIKNKKIYTIDTFHYFDDESQNPVEYQKIDQEIDQILSTIKFISSTDEVKTYLNQQFGYSFKYSSSLGEISESGSQVRLQTPISYQFEIIAYPTTESLEEWLKNNQSLFPVSDWIFSKSKFKNQPALLLNPKMVMESPGNIYIVKKDGNIFTFFYSVDPIIKTKIDQILSTFKFTNPQ